MVMLYLVICKFFQSVGFPESGTSLIFRTFKDSQIGPIQFMANGCTRNFILELQAIKKVFSRLLKFALDSVSIQKDLHNIGYFHGGTSKLRVLTLAREIHLPQKQHVFLFLYCLFTPTVMPTVC